MLDINKNLIGKEGFELLQTACKFSYSIKNEIKLLCAGYEPTDMFIESQPECNKENCPLIKEILK